MYANSRTVCSAQAAVHPRLVETVLRHREHRWRKPLSAAGTAAMAIVRPWLDADPATPWVLDVGCGTGAGSRALLARDPGLRVLGVDQSAARLRLTGSGLVAERSPGLLLIRAPMEDLWRLLLAEGRHPARQLLWYPNPWPKPEHLQRRWHGHPVFPAFVALGGELEARSNWPLYLEELAVALGLFGAKATIEAIADAEPAVSPFERKYRDSGQALWVLRCRLPAVPQTSCSLANSA
jgi:tRNA (guanine-N7-)-methyltransferase